MIFKAIRFAGSVGLLVVAFLIRQGMDRPGILVAVASALAFVWGDPDYWKRRGTYDYRRRWNTPWPRKLQKAFGLLMVVSGMFAVERFLSDQRGNNLGDEPVHVGDIVLNNNVFFLSLISLWAAWSWEFWTAKPKPPDSPDEPQTDADSN